MLCFSVCDPDTDTQASCTRVRHISNVDFVLFRIQDVSCVA